MDENDKRCAYCEGVLEKTPPCVCPTCGRELRRPTPIDQNIPIGALASLLRTCDEVAAVDLMLVRTADGPFEAQLRLLGLPEPLPPGDDPFQHLIMIRGTSFDIDEDYQPPRTGWQRMADDPPSKNGLYLVSCPPLLGAVRLPFVAELYDGVWSADFGRLKAEPEFWMEIELPKLADPPTEVSPDGPPDDTTDEHSEDWT